MGSSMGHSRWSAMLLRSRQRVEICMLGVGGLGWFEQVTSGAFPSGLAGMNLSFSERQWAIMKHV